MGVRRDKLLFDMGIPILRKTSPSPFQLIGA